jgi:hypothetical protein
VYVDIFMKYIVNSNVILAAHITPAQAHLEKAFQE